MRAQKRRTARFATTSVLLLLAAAGVLDNVLQFRHTLAHGGRWVSAKFEALRAGGGGGGMHMASRSTLRGNRLNLERKFHGFLYGEPLEPQRAEFDFLLQGPHLTFVFNKTGNGFEGLRIDALAGGFYFAAEPGGRFLRREPLNGVLLRSGWNRLAASSTAEWIEVSVNGVPSGTVPARFARGLIGFRGSSGAAWVDNVRVEGADGVLVDETFHHWRGLRGKFLLLAAALALAALALARLAAGAGRGAGPSDGVVRGAAVLAAGVWAFSFLNFHYISAKSGAPPAVPVESEEKKAALLEEALVKHGRKPPPGVTRILFLGTSQAGGPGVRPEQLFVRRLETALNARGRGRYECLNAAVSGVKPEEILEMYEAEWRAWNARLVVVYLSPKHDAYDAYREKLKSVLELNRSLSVRTLLVLEARSQPRPRWADALRALAKEHRLPLVDLQARLTAAADEGFLWLDRSHLSAAGHELVARALEEPVLSSLE
jgi:lysophospholipase L1-like esterase